MAMVSPSRVKGLFVNALKGFSLRCRDKNSSSAFPNQSISVFLLFSVYCLLLGGCGYTLHGKAALPFDAIQIERIENRTLEPKLQDRFHRVITEEFLKNGITVSPKAEYKLSGTITFFEMHVLAERDVAVEYEIVMRGDFKLLGPSGDTKDIKGIGSPFIVSFPGSGLLEDVLALKERASERALRDMATEIVGILIYSVRKEDSSNGGYK
ncbi:MAG: LptE family protein [Nitrospirota bacterium]